MKKKIFRRLMFKLFLDWEEFDKTPNRKLVDEALDFSVGVSYSIKDADTEGDTKVFTIELKIDVSQWPNYEDVCDELLLEDAVKIKTLNTRYSL